MDTATLHGSGCSKLLGGKGVDLHIVIDSGCSKEIISEDIVPALGIRVAELEYPLSIIRATGDCLNIVGTCTLFMKTQEGYCPQGR